METWEFILIVAGIIFIIKAFFTALASDGIIGDIANIIFWILRNWWKILIGVWLFLALILPMLADLISSLF